jgi:replication factor C subunit 1
MVDVRDFFKKPGLAPKSKPEPKHEIISVDDDDEKEHERNTTKRRKLVPPSPQKKPSKSTTNDEDFDVEEMDFDDDFDDDSDIEITEIAPPSKLKRAVSSKKVELPKKVTKKPEISQPKSPIKTEKSPKKTTKAKPVPKQESSSGVTADDVLKDIPDAELPEVDDSKKFNFFQNKKSDTGGSDEPVDIPEAQPNCLSGLTIVFTGVLPRLDRDASENLAKRYGAKVTKSISGKTSLVVLGDEAGPSKVKKIKQLKIKAINEDGFIQLLQSMPAEGGDGEAAQRAKLKREEEELKLLEDIERQEKEDEEKEKKALEKAQVQLQQAQASQSDPNRPPPEQPRVITNDEKLWTVKYAPTSESQLCGNKGQIAKLHNWLANWFHNAKTGFKNPGSDGSGVFRACLISGPPGIGKTSAAHIVAKSLGFDVLEKNASDVRSKSLLNSNIKSVLNNTSVVGFFNKASTDENKQKFVLIMDEVDGMSSGDHGGAGALSAFCKITQMPMILICNDKSLPKMRTFDRVTYDLAFRRPSETEMRSRLMMIAHREKIKLDPSIIGQLVQATGNDIRQIINLLSTVSKTQKFIGTDQAREVSKSWKKQTVLKPFDITGKLLNGQIYLPSSNHSLNDKIDLYFNDIDFTPLMIQENYLNTRPSNSSSAKNHLERVAQAADDISLSDRINSLIRSSEQQWSLLPFHGVMSSVKPSLEVAGNMQGRINFAGWLGQNSKAMKYQRLLQELQYHTRLRTSTSKTELRLEYMPLLMKKLSAPLIEDAEAGIEEVIAIMDEYFLTKEDWDYILDFGVGNDRSEVTLKKIATKVKTSFTRKYNSGTHPVAIYKTGNSVANATKKQSVDYEGVVEDDTVKDDDEPESQDTDKIDSKKDKLIKEVKPKKKTTRKAKAKK